MRLRLPTHKGHLARHPPFREKNAMNKLQKTTIAKPDAEDFASHLLTAKGALSLKHHMKAPSKEQREGDIGACPEDTLDPFAAAWRLYWEFSPWS